MTIDDQIRDEKLQYEINRKAAIISALSSNKIDKYEYLTGEEILPSNQKQIIEQAKFTYSPLGKAFEKQTKTIEDQREKNVQALEDLKPKEQIKSIKGNFTEVYESVEMKNEMNEIKEYEKKSIETLWFIIQAKNHSILKHLRQSDLLVKIAINEADQEQDDLIEYILNFSDKARTKNRDTKKKKKKCS